MIDFSISELWLLTQELIQKKLFDFRALLAYFYTGELQCPPAEIIEIHAALDFYGLQDWKNIVALCENVYYDEINLKDVPELYQKALKYNINELKERIETQFDKTLYNYSK